MCRHSLAYADSHNCNFQRIQAEVATARNHSLVPRKAKFLIFVGSPLVRNLLHVLLKKHWDACFPGIRPTPSLDDASSIFGGLHQTDLNIFFVLSTSIVCGILWLTHCAVRQFPRPVHDNSGSICKNCSSLHIFHVSFH